MRGDGLGTAADPTRASRPVGRGALALRPGTPGAKIDAVSPHTDVPPGSPATAGRRRWARLGGAVAASAVAVLALAPAAHAEEPVAMTARVEDLSSDQVAADALDRLEDAADGVVEETDLDLWTVYVDSFDGANSTDWANDTAIASNASTDVVLLAIAVEDGEVGLSADRVAPISDAELADLRTAASREVQGGRWADASLVVADELVAIGTVPEPDDDGDPTTAPTSPTSSGGGAGWVVLVVIAVVLVGGILLVRSRRRSSQNAPAGTNAPIAPATPEQQWAEVSTAELGQRAGSALVELDNDVRSSTNELAFAEAQFGIEATRAFKATLDVASQQLSQAFTIQQQLGNETREDAQRHGLIQILGLCAAAEEALDSQTEALQQLRSLQDRAPEVLAELDQRAGELAARLPAARDALNRLGATYPATALATVARAPEQAEALLASVQQSVAEGRARVEAGDRATAVAYARTAEDALQQVGQLLDMVARAGETLADAATRLDGEIAELTSDVSDAGRLAPDDTSIAPVVRRAQAAIEAGTAARSGGDPLAALTELAAAQRDLDAALAPRREHEQVQVRAAGRLTTQLGAAESAVRQANDFIETSRGAVGPSARSTLAGAVEALNRARALQPSQPEEALAAATAALEGASAAMRQAQDDVGRWHRTYGGPPAGRPGGVDAGSLILGGILNEVLGGGRSRGGWGGSGSRGGYGGGRSSSWGGSSSSGGGGRRLSGSIGGGGGGSRRTSGGSRRRSGGGRRR